MRQFWSLVALVTFLWTGTALAAAPLMVGQGGFSLSLTDQYDRPVVFPLQDEQLNEDGSTPVTVLVLADKDGAAQSEAWGTALAKAFPKHLTRDAPPGLVVLPVAHLKAVPSVMRGMVKGFFVAPDDQPEKPPVALDWEGQAAARLGFQRGTANLFVFDPKGVLRASLSGEPKEENVDKLKAALAPLLK